jgi:hypothetical protein
MELDKELFLVNKRGFQFVFRLHVKRGMGRHLTFFVKRREVSSEDFKLCNPHFRQIPHVDIRLDTAIRVPLHSTHFAFWGI